MRACSRLSAGLLVALTITSGSCGGGSSTPTEPGSAHSRSTYAVRGTVRSGSTSVYASPLAGATVSVSSLADPNARATATANGAGAYSLFVAPGTYTIQVAAPFYDPAADTVTVTNGDTTRDYGLIPAGPEIAGTVRDAASGAPVDGATVQITTGANAGRGAATTDSGGAYLFKRAAPGAFTLTVSKAGFEPAQPSGTLANSDVSTTATIDVALRRSTTVCIESVVPAFAKYFPSAGGDGEATVTASPNCAWTATTADPWLQVVSGSAGIGPGRIVFRAERNPETYGTDFRRGTIAVGQPSFAGLEVRVWQVPDCKAFFTWSPTTPNPFPAAGGSGGIYVLTDSPFTCPWQAVSQADWITIPGGIVEGKGDGQVNITVAPNTTGADRTSVVLIAEKSWQVVQKG